MMGARCGMWMMAKYPVGRKRDNAFKIHTFVTQELQRRSERFRESRHRFGADHSSPPMRRPSVVEIFPTAAAAATNTEKRIMEIQIPI